MVESEHHTSRTKETGGTASKEVATKEVATNDQRLHPPGTSPGEPGASVSFSTTTVLKVAAALIVFFAVTTLLTGAAQYFGSEGWSTVLSPLDSGAELSVPTWFSAVLLGLAGLVALVIVSLTGGSTRDRRGWMLVALALMAMSVDEVAGLHERLIEPVRSGLGTTGLLHFAWVIPGAVVVVAYAVLVLPFWRRLPRTTRLGMLFGACLFVAGALGLEMISGLFLTRYGAGPVSAVTSLVEEALEMAGSTVLLGVLLTHLRRIAPSVRLDLRP